MPAQQALTQAEQILLGAAKHHGMSSLFLSPVRGALNLAGRVFGKPDLGKTVIEKGIVAPSEKITRSAKIFDHPVLGFPFKKKVTPEEVAAYAQHKGLGADEIGNLMHQVQYGRLGAGEIAKLPGRSKTLFRGATKGFDEQELKALRDVSGEFGQSGIHSKNIGEALEKLQARGVSLTPQQQSQLNKYIEWSKPYAHRLSAPFETVGKAIVLPMAGAMYMHEKLDRYQKERLYKQQLQRKRQQQLANLSPGYYNRYTMSKGGEAVSGSEQVMMKRADVNNAVRTIQELTKVSQDLQAKVAYYETKEVLYKKAADLVGQGLLDPTQIELWVEQNISDTGDTAKVAQTYERSIPVSYEQTGLGSLAESSGSKGRGQPMGGGSSQQVMLDFVYGGGSPRYPGT